MSQLLWDLRHGVRLLRRTPGFTGIAILVLTLGIGANTAVFSLVNALVLQPRPGRIDQLVGVFSRDRTRPDQYRDFSYPTYLDLRARPDVFDGLMAHTFSTVGIAEGDATKQSLAALVSANYFSTLGVEPAAGRVFSAEEERPGANTRVAIASHSMWRRTGFDPAFVGRTVRVNGSNYTVIGVAPRGFAGTMAMVSPEWWFPLGSFDIVVNENFKFQSTGLGDRGHYALNLAGSLRPGVTREAAERALDELGRRLATEHPATDGDQSFVLAGLPRLSVSTRPESNGPIESADNDPIGQQILVRASEGSALESWTIVGVVSEMRHDIFDIEPRPHVFLPSGSLFRASLTLHVRTAPSVPDRAMLETIRRELLAIDERLPILWARTMADHRFRSLTEWSVRAAATLFTAFGLLALLLATIGVYGLKAYDVSRRTREIGIRIALGATGGDVLRLALREGVRTTIIGLGIGLMLAAGVGRLVSGLLYRVSPFDPLVLFVATAALSVSALAASYFPARRAARVAPLDALRAE